MFVVFARCLSPTPPPLSGEDDKKTFITCLLEVLTGDFDWDLKKVWIGVWERGEPMS